MTHSEAYVEIGDLVIFQTEMLGRPAYKVVSDSLHIKLKNIETNFEYPRCFTGLTELQEFIRTESIELVSL